MPSRLAPGAGGAAHRGSGVAAPGVTFGGVREGVKRLEKRGGRGHVREDEPDPELEHPDFEAGDCGGEVGLRGERVPTGPGGVADHRNGGGCESATAFMCRLRCGRCGR